jgi:hypothetical protein
MLGVIGARFGRVLGCTLATVTEDPSLTRIDFLLEPDADGYPPASVETIWAVDLGDGTYRLDNTPFFAKGVSAEDVVEAPITDGRPTFSIVLRRGGHSTVRVVVFDPTKVADTRAMLAGLGASSELSHIPQLISVDIPPEARLEEILRVLAAGESGDRWTYEGADLPG